MLISGCTRFSNMPLDQYPSPLPSIKNVNTSARLDNKLNASIPISLRYIPSIDTKKVFDSLLGNANSVYFLQNDTAETFIVFNDDSYPAKMAQFRILKKETGIIAILVGIANSSNPSISGIYSFEYGIADPAIVPYRHEKIIFF